MSKKIIWKKNYKDRDLTFCLQIHSDESLAQLCLKRLRKIYPKCNIICIIEKVNRKRIKYFKRYNVDIFYGEELYKYKKNSSVVKRMFDVFLLYDSDYFFKIDTDTQFIKRFRKLPVSDCSFGHKRRAQKTRIIQAGCLGYTRGVIEDITKSDFLQIMNHNNDYSWIRPGNVLGVDTEKYFISKDIVSFDMISAYAVKARGFPIVSYDEIYSVWIKNLKEKDIIEIYNGDYSVIHPCIERIERCQK
ncbi:MAG: hypothetical protein ACOC56_03425 [Atribacterota bacterium]